MWRSIAAATISSRPPSLPSRSTSTGEPRKPCWVACACSRPGSSARAHVLERVQRLAGVVDVRLPLADAVPVGVPDVDLALEVGADHLGRAVAVQVGGGERGQERAADVVATPRLTGRRARRCAAAACRRAPASPAAPSRRGAVGVHEAVGGPSPARCGCRRRGPRASARTRRRRASRRPCGEAGQHVLVAVQVHVAAVLALQRRAALVELRHHLHREAVRLGVRPAVRGLGAQCRARGRRSFRRWPGTAPSAAARPRRPSTPSNELVCVSPSHHVDGTRLKSPGGEAVSGSLFGYEPGATNTAQRVAGAAREHRAAQLEARPAGSTCVVPVAAR